MSSRRLPKKVLAEIDGVPMIQRQLERIHTSQRLQSIVVATSVHDSDDELVEFLNNRGYEVRRGPLQDVGLRFAAIADEFQPESVVRLTADCPLADPNLIDDVIEAHLLSESDYTSNTLLPTFPDGLDVECFTTAAFNRLREYDLSPEEREHVTLGFHLRNSEFKICSVEQDRDDSELRWTVDVEEDLEFIRYVYSKFPDNPSSFNRRDVSVLLNNEPSMIRRDSDYPRNASLQSNELYQSAKRAIKLNEKRTRFVL